MPRLSQYRRVMNELRSKEYSSFTREELEAMYPSIMREVNRRLAGMRRAGLYDTEHDTYDSPAAQDYLRTARHKKLSEFSDLSTKKYLGKLRNGIYSAVQFLESKTSTVSATKEFVNQLNVRFGTELSHDQIRDAWRVLDAIRKERATYLMGYNEELQQIVSLTKQGLSFEETRDYMFNFLGITENQAQTNTEYTNLMHDNDPYADDYDEYDIY